MEWVYFPVGISGICPFALPTRNKVKYGEIKF
jgi:hypothetical protein